jgi:oligopeptide transport system ATP-binding protein
MASVPRLDGDARTRLVPIDGQPPDLAALPGGCAFAPRCAHAFDPCRLQRPALEAVATDARHLKACFADAL